MTKEEELIRWITWFLKERDEACGFNILTDTYPELAEQEATEEREESARVITDKVYEILDWRHNP